MLTAPAGL